MGRARQGALTGLCQFAPSRHEKGWKGGKFSKFQIFMLLFTSKHVVFNSFSFIWTSNHWSLLRNTQKLRSLEADKVFRTSRRARHNVS